MKRVQLTKDGEDRPNRGGLHSGHGRTLDAGTERRADMYGVAPAENSIRIPLCLSSFNCKFRFVE